MKDRIEMKDRKTLIRIASDMPKGDPARKVILAELRMGRTAPRWATRAIERALNGRSHTGMPWRDLLEAVDPQVRRKASRASSWDRWILIIGEALEGSPVHNANKLDALWDDVLIAGDQNYQQHTGFLFSAENANELEEAFFNHIAKL